MSATAYSVGSGNYRAHMAVSVEADVPIQVTQDGIHLCIPCGNEEYHVASFRLHDNTSKAGPYTFDRVVPFSDSTGRKRKFVQYADTDYSETVNDKGNRRVLQIQCANTANGTHEATIRQESPCYSVEQDLDYRPNRNNRCCTPFCEAAVYFTATAVIALIAFIVRRVISSASCNCPR
ncbi:MAG TPA: hypothetical protein VN457_03270 [Chlamydiales bacterium]|nr:hypothetical protein [Chlamydiales bacterium]